MPVTLIECTSTYVRIKTALTDFDTRYRYLKEVATGTAFQLPAGKTCEFIVQNSPTQGSSGTRQAIHWRYECGAYAVEKARMTAYQDNVGTTHSVTLTAPVVGGSAITVDAP